ncbi:LysR family transcriptional regulator [Vibrio hannami]|uniref:LysR family transcriptional regulator n=1 Tax=Vibrio hannami TaxID=2717094 RepID=UPI0024105B8D|nr:LysR family transcriptional regulator [Vibrio hannami]MDG3086514.1 LysR family transcriptional regulator [Vibrio hannami]
MFDRLTAFRTFRAIVKTGSITSAANELGVAKSSVSRHLTNLEEWANCKLFLRTTRTLTLTKAGEYLYEQSSDLIDRFEYIEEKLPLMERSLTGRLRVTLPPEIWTIIVGQLSSFYQQHPDLKISFDFSDRLVDLYNEPFDLAIRVGEPKNSSLYARKLGVVQDMLVASPTYLSCSPPLHTPEDLTDHSCLLDMYRTPPDIWNFTDFNGNTANILVSGNYSLNNTQAVIEAAIQGLGIANVSGLLAEQECLKGNLIHLLTDYETESYQVHALFAEKKFMPEKTRAFIDFLVSVFEGNSTQ